MNKIPTKAHAGSQGSWSICALTAWRGEERLFGNLMQAHLDDPSSNITIIPKRKRNIGVDKALVPREL